MKNVWLRDPYIRDIASFLRNEYGVNPRPARRRRPPAFAVDYNGSSHVIMLNSPGHPGNNLLPMKKQDIRRQLGAPPMRVPGSEKSLEQKAIEESIAMIKENIAMIDNAAATQPTEEPPVEAAPKPAVHHPPIRVKVCCYQPGYIRVLLDKSTEARLFGGNGTLIDLDSDTWTIRPHPHKKGRFTAVTDKEFVMAHYQFIGLERFGSTAAETQEVDGALLIRCDPATRARVTSNTASTHVEQEIVKPQGGIPLAVRPPTQAPEPEKSLEERMLAVLREIRDLETHGTHQLVLFETRTKSPGEWRPVYRAIRLHD